MARDIEHLAREFETKLGLKTARKRGTRMNVKKIHKELDKARKEYKDSSKRLQDLESQLAKLEEDLQDCRSSRRGSRSKFLNLNNVLQRMDLSDARHAIFYDDDEDVGYIIDGEEKYLDMTDEGEISLKPMKEWRKEKRQANKEDENDVPPGISIDNSDDSDSDDEDEYDYDDADDEEEEEEDDSSADDSYFPFNYNFRFVD